MSLRDLSMVNRKHSKKNIYKNILRNHWPENPFTVTKHFAKCSYTYKSTGNHVGFYPWTNAVQKSPQFENCHSSVSEWSRRRRPHRQNHPHPQFAFDLHHLLRWDTKAVLAWCSIRGSVLWYIYMTQEQKFSNISLTSSYRIWNAWHCRIKMNRSSRALHSRNSCS